MRSSTLSFFVLLLLRAGAAEQSCSPEDADLSSHLQVHERSQELMRSRMNRTGQLFKKMPMLQTHDAATGLIGKGDQSIGSSIQNFVAEGYAITQTVEFVDQLNCGARAFDMRVYDRTGDGTDVRFNHGAYVINGYTVEAAVKPVVTWAQSHPNELVVIILTFCATGNLIGLQMDAETTYDETVSSAENTSSDAAVGAKGSLSKVEIHNVDCSSNFQAPFKKLGIPVYGEKNCGEIWDWTEDQAKEAAKLEGGGHVIVVIGRCVFKNTDLSIMWKDQECPGGESWKRLWDYDSASVKKSWDGLFMTQSFWQQPTDLSTVGYSMIKANENSGINAENAKQIKAGLFDGVNLLMMNNICSNGPDMAEALGTTVSAADRSACSKACGTPKDPLGCVNPSDKSCCGNFDPTCCGQCMDSSETCLATGIFGPSKKCSQCGGLGSTRKQCLTYGWKCSR